MLREFDYEGRVLEASNSQGISAIVSELKKLGIESEIDQTGGFCMVGRVQLDEDNAYPYIGFNSECICLYRGDDIDEEVIATFNYDFVNGNHVADFAGIARTIKTVLYNLEEADFVYVCLSCEEVGFHIMQGRFVIQSEAYTEFYCYSCAQDNANLLKLNSPAPIL